MSLPQFRLLRPRTLEDAIEEWEETVKMEPPRESKTPLERISTRGTGSAQAYRDLELAVRPFGLSLNDFATSRAHSTKRSITGLWVRFFNVVITTGHG